ncbi:beta-ketoacyl synthase N-terminal-like domain-containing protein [Bifidobacterium sp. ESL0690]|uniref:beta-ketoacyl synthase N-terminal-like domain-containing protein n=1 Tax=Bifidobacterium sp. ESL0690 TaxID=2983214 RepID=UPI0023F802ED|nr:beta-ketoacyl synthase N-terminal-like domain-containing protein [Bifidobacterium sp. ESL0690]WEV47403.1 beta-ketoacyl synthase N-terminal-like domain-containing protein [Bifidobacterium sp. ESL0690]
MSNNSFEPIAIVGTGCVLPPSSFSPEEFWQAVTHGVSGIAHAPKNRWNNALEYLDADRSAEDKTYCGVGGFVVGYHGPQGHSPDGKPWSSYRLNRTQQFIVDTAEQAFAQAGIDVPDRRRCRLLLGNMLGDEAFDDDELVDIIHELLSEDGDELPVDLRGEAEKAIDHYVMEDKVRGEANTSTDLARVPSKLMGMDDHPVLVDGACASGLLMVDLASRYLHRYPNRMIMAVGAMSNMSVTGNVTFAKVGGLSDRAPKPLDAHANGLVPAEGSSTVLLCTPDYARAKGYKILALVTGAFSTSDGRGKAIYAPKPAGQLRAMSSALATAGENVERIDYIETHATGTPAGDASELSAIADLVGHRRRGPMPVGSVKNLIGHGFPVAGMSNLLVVLEAMKHATFPAVTGVETPNEVIVEHPESLMIHTRPARWERPGDGPRRALINAFGFGGINSSIVLEQYDGSDATDIAEVRRPEGRDASYLVVQSVSHSACKRPDGLLEDPMKDVDWRVFRMPPVLVSHMDVTQRLAILAAKDIMEDVRKEPKDTVGALFGQPSGLAVGGRRELRIRLVEVNAAIDRSSMAADDKERVKQWIDHQVKARIEKTSEASLPGYMDNIISGRVANMFDLTGPNYIVDAGTDSFGTTLELAQLQLSSHEADAMIVGSSFANPSRVVNQDAAELGACDIALVRTLDWGRAHPDLVKAVIRIDQSQEPAKDLDVLKAATLVDIVHNQRWPARRFRAAGASIDLLSTKNLDTVDAEPAPQETGPEPAFCEPQVNSGMSWLGIGGSDIADCISRLQDVPVASGQATPENVRVMIPFDSEVQKNEKEAALLQLLERNAVV